MKTLNIIGCGKVGMTLGRLWHENGIFAIGGIANRSLASAEKAAAFIGAGVPCAAIEGLPVADISMIATPDGEIEAAAKKLREAGKASAIMFHCSGSLPASILGVETSASLHPVRSFVDPARSVADFPGTMCGVEGDRPALDILEPAIRQCGGETFAIKPDAKVLYHAAAVFICNYLPPLLETGYRLYEEAGVSRDTATKIMKPIVAETVENVFTAGPAAALTGPIARGDADTVRRHLAALADYDADLRALYQMLGKLALNLSSAPQSALDEVRDILGS